MGYGSYSMEDRTTRAFKSGYYEKSVHEVTSSSMKDIMNPLNVHIRESKDSDDHPNTVPIIIGLDLTGSMYNVPSYLVKDGLPNIMNKILQSGISDPQVLFIGIGDHEYDKSPLQVGQFESSDDLLDKWLTSVWLEGGGGGNDGESYLLAWYFAAYHTQIDSFDKRGKKGILITIGDEPTLKTISGYSLDMIMGGQHKDTYTAIELLEKAKEKYHVFHIHVTDTSRGSNERTLGGWKQLLGNNFIILNDHKLIANKIPMLIAETNKMIDSSNEPFINTINDIKDDESEMML